MFSQTHEYAMRVIAHLASLGGKPATAKEIAVVTRVPASYLSKVLHSLTRSGLVQSQRGLHGGSVLARPAEDMTLYDVAEAIDPIPRITSCPLGLRSHGSRLCAVHQKLDETMELVEKKLKSITVAELLEEPSSSKPLCDIAAGDAPAPIHRRPGRPVKIRVTRRT